MSKAKALVGGIALITLWGVEMYVSVKVANMLFGAMFGKTVKFLTKI